VYALYTLLFVYIGSSWGVIGASIGINISLILNFIIITLFTQRLLKYKCLEYFKIYIPGGILGGIVLIETSFIIYYLRYIVNSDIGLVIIIALNSFFCIILPLVLFPNVFRVFWIYFFRVIKLATVNENIFIRFYKNKILNKLARYG